MTTLPCQQSMSAEAEQCFHWSRYICILLCYFFSAVASILKSSCWPSSVRHRWLVVWWECKSKAHPSWSMGLRVSELIPCVLNTNLNLSFSGRLRVWRLFDRWPINILCHFTSPDSSPGSSHSLWLLHAVPVTFWRQPEQHSCGDTRPEAYHRVRSQTHCRIV